jgi:prevent-host-death family protein
MQISISKARNNLSAWIQEAEEQPVTITRRGQPVGTLISYAEYASLRRARGWMEMMRLSQDLRHSGVTASELFRCSRDELEKRP